MYRLLIVLLLLLSSCEKVFFEEEPENDPLAVFNQIWSDFRQIYGPFEERGVNWDALGEKYRPKVTRATSEDELFAVLASMLAELNDGHVRLTAPDKPIFQSNKVFREQTGDDLFDMSLIKNNYLTNGFTDHDSYVYGLINTDIIYVYLKYIDGLTPILEKLADQYPDAKGMIIDLRHGQGGDFTWAFPSLARFTDQKRLVFSSATRNGPDLHDFTAWYEWYLEPAGNYYSKPLSVLIDRYTISASERTAMALDVLPQATLLGDTTSGAHSTMIGRQLQNGWFYTVATQKTKFADGKSYEGIGIAPDILLQNDRALMQKGTDSILERAIQELK